MAADDVDDNDRALFREAVGRVQRVVHQRDRSKPQAPAPKPRQHHLDEQAVMDELASGRFDFSEVETGEEISYLDPSLAPKTLKQLRRGHWRVQEELDLHQMTVAAATVAIRDFLAEAHARGITAVKIIHGKGLRSGPEGPKLKRMTASVLARHRHVLAFASAPPTDGGTGAVHVLLKR